MDSVDPFVMASRATGGSEPEFDPRTAAKRDIQVRRCDMGDPAQPPNRPDLSRNRTNGRGERDSPSLTQQSVSFLLVNRTPPREAVERTA